MIQHSLFFLFFFSLNAQIFSFLLLPSGYLPSSVGSRDLEVDAVVKAPPDKETLDVGATRQTVIVQIDPEQTAVSLVMNPSLIIIYITCTSRSSVIYCSERGRNLHQHRTYSLSLLIKVIYVTWAWFAINAIRHSLITRHNVVLHHDVCPLANLKYV